MPHVKSFGKRTSCGSQLINKKECVNIANNSVCRCENVSQHRANIGLNSEYNVATLSSTTKKIYSSS